jgi:hypothetical protein
VKDVKMVIIGSCRGKEDENLLKDLTEYSSYFYGKSGVPLYYINYVKGFDCSSHYA